MTEAQSTIAERFLALLLHRHFVAGCLAVHVLLRVAVIVLLPLSMTSDAGWYVRRGIGIAAGNGYSEAGVPTAYWPVGYPAFLGLVFWLFGPYIIAAQLANVLLSAASVLLCLALARVMLHDEVAARLAMLLLTVYPNNIAYAGVTLSETFFTLVLMLGTYVYIRSRAWPGVLLSGIIFGAAALTKPQVLLFPLMLVVLRLFLEPRGRRIGNAALGLALYIAMIAVLAPWSVRNFLIFHEVVLVSTNGGSNLLIGNNPRARGNYTQDAVLTAQVRFSVADQVAADRRAGRLAVRWIRENPGRFVALMPLKVWWLWAPDGEAEWEYQAGHPRYQERVVAFRLIRLLNQAFYVAVLIASAASAAMVAVRGLPSPWLLLVYGFAIYVTLIAVVFFGYSRYHFPLMPWIMIAAAWSTVTLLRRSAWSRKAAPAPQTIVS
jgi:4-amino-4-deoxy-L-arabinose transferase-like glycosyltransferase